MKTLIPWNRVDPLAESWLPLSTFFFDHGANGRADAGFAPAIELTENDAQIVVRAELPGVDAKEVELELVENFLVLSGKKEERREQKEGETTRTEFRFGSFRRELELPAQVDGDTVKATCEKGVLTVTLNKSAASKTRKISVEAR